MNVDGAVSQERDVSIARERLKNRIERRVRLVTEALELGGRRFEWYRVPIRMFCYRVRQQLGSAPRRARSDWAATWRAANGLDQFFAAVSICQRSRPGTWMRVQGKLVLAQQHSEPKLR